MMVCMGCRASLLDQDMINSGHGSLVSLTCVDQCCSLCHHSPRTNHQSAAAQSVGAQSVLLAAAGSGSHTLLRWLLLHSLAASDQTRIFSDQWIYLIHHLWAQRNKFFLQFYHSIFFFKSWCIKDPKLWIMKYPGLGRGLWLCLLLPTRLISQNDVCHTHRSSENTSNNCSTFFILFSECKVEKIILWRYDAILWKLLM